MDNILSDIFEQEDFLKVQKNQFEEVHLMETEELLDNLGYISINQNDKDDFVSPSEVLAGIVQFRSEYLDTAHVHLFKDKYPVRYDLRFDELTEDELDFLEYLSSLEGGFKLHSFSKIEIKNNPLLTRVLNFRLSITAFAEFDSYHKFLPKTNDYLNQVCDWCGFSTKNHKEAIRLLGSISDLSNLLASQTVYKNSKYSQIVYFKNKVDFDEERAFRKQKNKNLFTSVLIDLSKESRIDFEVTKKRTHKMAVKTEDKLNQIMLRMIQLRLYLFGTYGGRLDNDVGPMSFKAITDLLDYIHKTIRKKVNIKLIITYHKYGYWSINSTYLLTKIMTPFDRHLDEIESRLESNESRIQSSTITEIISDAVDGLNDDDKDEVFNEIKKDVLHKDISKNKRKTKTRGLKRFFISAKEFFSNTWKKLGKIVLNIVDAIREIFQIIKNGISILLREIKKTYNLIKAGIAFLFSKRIIKTVKEQGTVALLTDYDLDFDSITNIKVFDTATIQVHIEKNKYLATAVEEASDFMGMVLYLVIKIASGPAGWLKLGIYVIKNLAAKSFTYQRFTFSI